MTLQQDLVALRDRLREVLGNEHATTLMAMVRERDDLVTTSDLKREMADFRTELKGEVADLRTDMAEFKTEVKSEITQLRTEMDLKFATREDLAEMSASFQNSLHSFVRTFVVTQVASVVGVAGIVVGLLQFL